MCEQNGTLGNHHIPETIMASKTWLSGAAGHTPAKAGTFAPGLVRWMHKCPETMEAIVQDQFPVIDDRVFCRFVLQGLFLGWLFRDLTATT